MTVEAANRLRAEFIPRFSKASKMVADAIEETLSLHEQVVQLQNKHRDTLDEYDHLWPDFWLERMAQPELRRRLDDLLSLDGDKNAWVEERKFEKREDCDCQ